MEYLVGSHTQEPIYLCSSTMSDQATYQNLPLFYKVMTFSLRTTYSVAIAYTINYQNRTNYYSFLHWFVTFMDMFPCKLLSQLMATIHRDSHLSCPEVFEVCGMEVWELQQWRGSPPHPLDYHLADLHHTLKDI